MLPPWEDQTYRRPLRVKVRSPDEVPYAVDSTDADLQRVLTEEWPHEFVLAAVSSVVAELPPEGGGTAQVVEKRRVGDDPAAGASRHRANHVVQFLG